VRFEFRRGCPGEDGPLVGHRISGDRVDLVLIEAFSRNCFAWRQRTTSLIIPGRGLVERQVEGSATEIIWVDGGTGDGHGWQPAADDIERAEISTTRCAAVIWIGCSIQPRAPSTSVRPQGLGQPPVKNNRTTSSLLNRWLAAG
jgi:hypothetical protein